MDYKGFKKEVTERFESFLPEEYKEYGVDFREVQKINERLDGIILKGKRVAPTIYINDMFRRYEQVEDLEQVMREYAEIMVRADKEHSVAEKLSFENIKDNIIYQLINYEQNKEFLERVPHRRFLDLALIYRWVIKEDGDELQTAIINNSMMKIINLNEPEIAELAVLNTEKVFQPMTENILDTLKRMNEDLYGGLDTDSMPPMYIITNKKGNTEQEQYYIANT